MFNYSQIKSNQATTATSIYISKKSCVLNIFALKWIKGSHCLYDSSIFSTYLIVPMMSSRYSKKPSSWGPWAFGFMSEICSTSPWKVTDQTWKEMDRTSFISFIKTKKKPPKQQMANLKDQKPVIVKVNTFPFKFLGNFSEVTRPVINVILRGVITESNPGNHKITSWNSLICSIILQPLII